MRSRVAGLLAAVLLAATAGDALAQVIVGGRPTCGEETKTISTTVETVTANLCGPSNGA